MNDASHFRTMFTPCPSPSYPSPGHDSPSSHTQPKRFRCRTLCCPSERQVPLEPYPTLLSFGPSSSVSPCQYPPDAPTLLGFVNDTLMSTYPAEPRNKVASVWLIRAATRVVDMCPVKKLCKVVGTLTVARISPRNTCSSSITF